MQLDLLYKGLPSAHADTRSSEYKYTARRFSFIQHGQGGRRGTEGGTGSLFTHPPSPPPPRTSPGITFPPGMGIKGKKKNTKQNKKRSWQGWRCPQFVAAPSQPLALDCPDLPQRFQDKNLDPGWGVRSARGVNKAKKPFGLMQVQLLLSRPLPPSPALGSDPLSPLFGEIIEEFEKKQPQKTKENMEN